jgi:hypothetical protein
LDLAVNKSILSEAFGRNSGIDELIAKVNVKILPFSLIATLD